MEIFYPCFHTFFRYSFEYNIHIIDQNTNMFFVVLVNKTRKIVGDGFEIYILSVLKGLIQKNNKLKQRIKSYYSDNYLFIYLFR